MRTVRNRALTALVVANCTLMLGCSVLNSLGLKRDLAPLRRDMTRVTEKVIEGAGPVREALDNIDMDDERALGQAASMAVVRDNGGLLLDQPLTWYVNEVANAVAHAKSGKREEIRGKRRTEARRFFVGVLDSDALNAVSAPGGYIFVSRGLLQNMSSEAELAFVLGHEIAHIDQEHGLKGLKVAVAGKAFVAGSGGADFDDGKFFDQVADKLVDLLQKVGLGRQNESDADEAGLRYATEAGYTAEGARRVFELLIAESASTPKQSLAASLSHHDPAVRLRDLYAAIEAAKGGRYGVARYEKAMLRVDAAVAAK